jgi:glycosyltransferase involved in cell wall biosynthesis
MRKTNQHRLAILTNVVAPARVPMFSGLAEHFDLMVLHGGIESNRDSWNDNDRNIPNATVVKAWGWQIRIARRENGQIFDLLYAHVTPGYVWHLLRFRPDAIVTTEMGCRTLVALTYGALFRKPVWVWWGGTCHTERRRGLARAWVRRLISRLAHSWISYGQTSTEYLLTLGIPRDRILQIQNAVDETAFLSLVEPQFPLKVRPVVLHVGQLIARKGIENLLKAAALLQMEGCEFSLLLVGNGRERAALENLVADLGLKNVHFRRALSQDKMPAVYQSGDVLVIPTLEDVWGLVANEGILSGLTVLCSKYAGCAQELFSPENIFDPQNAEEFTAKLRDAVAGRLHKPDPARLLTTQQIVGTLIDTIESSLDRRPQTPAHHRPTGNLTAAKY